MKVKKLIKEVRKLEVNIDNLINEFIKKNGAYEMDIKKKCNILTYTTSEIKPDMKHVGIKLKI